MNLFKNIVLYLEWSLSKEWFLLLFWPKSEGGGGIKPQNRTNWVHFTHLTLIVKAVQGRRKD